MALRQKAKPAIVPTSVRHRSMSIAGLSEVPTQRSNRLPFTSVTFRARGERGHHDPVMLEVR